ncbi:FKBP-type peptidyl-prolyl cis-trans isomerase [Solemya velum gill symbiont]|uniref:FKBP-type peptidyl-prolyl cis-trans isomerase n=1 Tax=Solemya velum gill symbiont TaxID=2340 RepID=UPI0009986AC2|nr:peptidylprolyl isomerase [Solemya velum gill symbiont]OOZ43223.1 peptidylprolyl isomerase [Solemya velum gill symbiont]OOZ46194.1 peptidylprolyl isomerase [Solemya velum gill symbiont]OOZ49642.1 peptidylprolyl isomerase [Solemya velum gill symbiont]OOZ51230.1 peptidylprolyl isomerase [Solemya velum gill symbiont]OOZ53813.1 peptidylprolyl isomerase [Solemya velum gill symbiont]
MKETIQHDKYVELNYKVLDEKTGQVLSTVEFPIGYVHGANQVLATQVTAQLEGRTEGEVIEIPIDGNLIYGARDEGLVFTDNIENVPEEYREIGMKILMESEKGEPKEFIVTRMDDKTLTIDGNNPLCGRDLIFKLEILKVREATPEEIEAGTKVVNGPDIDHDPDRIVPI